MKKCFVITDQQANIMGHIYPIVEFSALEPDFKLPEPGWCYEYNQGFRNCYTNGEEGIALTPEDEQKALALIDRHLTRRALALEAQAVAEQQAQEAARVLRQKAADEDFAARRAALYPAIGDQLDAIIKSMRHLHQQGIDLGPEGTQIIEQIAEVKRTILPLLPQPDFTWALNTTLFMIYQHEASALYVVIPRVTANEADIAAAQLKTVTNKAVEKAVKAVIKRQFFLLEELPS